MQHPDLQVRMRPGHSCFLEDSPEPWAWAVPRKGCAPWEKSALLNIDWRQFTYCDGVGLYVCGIFHSTFTVMNT
jgi:hypothetical protein